MNPNPVRIITVDGPSGAGKGTICQMLAARLGFHYLDSGALYRLLALAARHHKVAWDNNEELAVLAAHMDISFVMNSGEDSPQVILEGEVVTDRIRSEEIGSGASIVAAVPDVRDALLERQRAFAVAPGLVADGRDMGTVVFPEADVKIFLTASVQERAQRRYNQLIGKGENVSLAALEETVRCRDERDMTRDVSPLVPASDAILVDTTGKTIAEVFEAVVAEVNF
ncbi:MAG: (d)CMP kinase [Porticoccaceae bacterium]|jgi:cytidylate kinase|nr:(d)CMP kinase [Porticoccaceae bacterium]